ncbi:MULTISPECIES: TetR/AcrR family transcriptional regulator [Enterobacteriaceae]|jgi:TetR/AcrR family transcriptional repressor of mexJK operon|nr:MULTISPECIES: TetR/AcrR family transcriptional regulator [Enterobacteriaceae]MDM2948311.1 TetR/AcrR family transcriptional regulator [Citrobacter sp. CK207]
MKVELMPVSDRASREAKNNNKNLPSEGTPAVSAKAQKVLAGAKSIFLARGYSAATTDMIQQAAGVSKSTVYAYYPNKEALFTAVVEQQCERFLQTVHDVKISGKDIADKLGKLARLYLDIVLSEDGLALYRVVASEAPRFPELGRRFYLAGPDRMNNIVADVLKDAELKGEIFLGGIGCASAASLFVNMVRGEPQMQCLMHPASLASAAQRDFWAKDAVSAFLLAFCKAGK